MKAATLPALIQRFFTDRLCVQMEASRHTVASYRDTFRLLLRFASTRHGKPPAKLTVEDVDADLVADFLVHGETMRGNTARSRNTRLAAVRSFFRYVALADPTAPQPAYPRDAQQTLRKARGDLPQRRRNGGTAGGSGPRDLDRAA